MNKIICGDALKILKTFKDESINCCITSPPYWGLRDYGTAKWEGGNPKCSHKRESKKSDKTITGHKNFEEMNGVGDAIYKETCKRCGAVRIDNQLGLEKTPEEYVAKLVEIFEEVKRTITKEGTLWLNLGDTYATSKEGNTQEIYKRTNTTSFKKECPKNLKPKDLVGIPWRVAFALQSKGWWLRQDIIWAKTNPMPESVVDRCTKAHEYIFLLSKNRKYYYDNKAIQEPLVKNSDMNYRKTLRIGRKYGVKRPYQDNQPLSYSKAPNNKVTHKNKRSVWTVSTKPFKEAHFATFPEDLILPCVLAGCLEKGIILDPFAGAGTVGVVAKKNNRNFIGIELNPEYIKIAEKRIKDTKLKEER